MGPTRKRDLAAAVVGAALVGYLAVLLLYRCFPPLTIWTGLSLAAVAVAEAVWGWQVRAKISDGEIGVGGGGCTRWRWRARVVIAKASAWVGALVLGWWLGGAGLSAAPARRRCGWPPRTPRARWWRPLCALALVVAALWLQHCCKSPRGPVRRPDATPD